MRIRTAFTQAAAAARANLWPGLILQACMAIFLLAYLTHDGTRKFLVQVAELKREMGYVFAFCSYVISAAFLPEVLRIVIFQRGAVRGRNVRNFLTSAPAWGCIGMLVDFFYRCQAGWFGQGHAWTTLVAKTAVDQFLFSPFLCTPLTVVYFLWRDASYDRAVFRKTSLSSFYLGSVIPVQVAGWCIWIPGVMLVYFMPSPLQIPVAVMIQTFWVLVFTLVDQRNKQPI